MQQAMRLSQQPTADLYDTLAAAYAESGEFDKAIEAQEEAIILAPERADFQASLKLYKSGTPRRGPSPPPNQ
jgi:tetratricopeptide (TPR) repeat protein